MNPELTIEQALNKYAEAHPLKFALHSQEGLENRTLLEDVITWLKANTEESKLCPECGGKQSIDIVGKWHCTNPNCGKVENE